MSYGALVAAFVNKTETAGIVYTFTLIPMVFLGGSLFTIPGLGEFGRYLPTNLLTDLIRPYFGFGEPDAIPFSVVLLLAYSVVITGLATIFFKTDR